MIRRLLPALLLVVAPFVVYQGVIDQPLGSDARFLTVRNALVTGEATPVAFFTRDFFEGASTGGFVYLSGYYRPITNSVLQAAWWVGGDDPRVYNGLGMLLHGIAAVLLVLLVARVTGHRWAGWIAGAAWVVHPVHAFAVTEPAALADPLATVFYLGALIAFARGIGIRAGDGAVADDAGPARGWIGVSVLLYLLAVLSKESGITFPAAAGALALLAYFRDGAPLKPRLLATLPLWITFGAYLAWRFGVLGIVPGSVGYADAVGSFALAVGVTKTVAIHLIRVVMPMGWELPEMHASLAATANASLTDPLTWLGLLFAGAGVAAALSWRRYPELAFWASLFIILWSPLARLDNIGGPLGTTTLLAQERWIYLPAVALIGGLTAWGARAWGSRMPVARARTAGWVAIAIAALILTGLGAAAATHAEVQRDPLAQLAMLYEIPDEALGRVGVASRLMNYAWRVALPQGDLADAVDRAEQAVELVPDSPIYARGLAGMRGFEGRWAEADALVDRWIDADSVDLARQAQTNYRIYDDMNRILPELWLVRGEASAQLGETERAIRSFCTAIARGHPVNLVVATVRRSPGVSIPLDCSNPPRPSPEGSPGA